MHEGATDKALDELKRATRLRRRSSDFGTMSGDLNQMGDVLREAGRPDEAAARYKEAVTAINKAQVPEEVKEETRRNTCSSRPRRGRQKGHATAKAKAAEYTKQVAVKKAPFEVRQQHELAGLIALAEKQPAMAAAEFTRANQQDPRILYLTAIAWREAGECGAGARSRRKRRSSTASTSTTPTSGRRPRSLQLVDGMT